MAATLGSARIILATVSMPRVGVWHADLELASETAISGRVTFTIEGVAFTGTVLRGGLDGGRVKAKIVGGAGMLSKELAAKFYVAPNVRQVLQDILNETGEALSSTADAAILNASLPKWERTKGPASRALVALLDASGATWRILRDGTLWIGKDTFPEANVEHNLLDEDWINGVTDIAPTAPDLLPGVTFRDRQISYVIHRLESSKLRTEAYVKQPGNVLEQFLGEVLKKIDYSRLYPAKVAKQNVDDRTLQLVPDDAKVKGAGLDRVPIRHGYPGADIEIEPGARVRLGFENGDPAKPYAIGWEPGAAGLRFGTLLIVQNALTFALLPPQWFPPTLVGDNAAIAAYGVALSSGNTAFLLNLKTATLSVKPPTPPIV